MSSYEGAYVCRKCRNHYLPDEVHVCPLEPVATRICERCGKVNPATIHTCTPKEVL